MIKTKTLIERWENVARVLKGMTKHQRKKHFDMDQWGYINDCGTVACAAGHCSLDPWFRKRGFRSYVRDEDVYTANGDIVSKKFLSFNPETSCQNEERVEEFFGVFGTDTVLKSFCSTFAQTSRAVQGEIRRLKKLDASGFKMIDHLSVE